MWPVSYHEKWAISSSQNFFVEQEHIRIFKTDADSYDMALNKHK
jgi:hypothetical protein